MIDNYINRLDRGESHKELINILSNNNFEKLPIYNKDFDDNHIKNCSIDVGLIKNFLNKDFCYKALREIISFSLMNAPIFKKSDPNRHSSNYWSMDILPRGVQTKRIFRNFIFGNLKKRNINLDNVSDLFEKIHNFHENIILASFNKNDKKEIFNNYSYSPQIIHYPTGGGYFDWHGHPAYPETYGICVCLSNTNVDKNRLKEFACMGSGQMLFKVKDKIFCGENQIDIGDMVIFKYDLPHCVTPCDPFEDITIGDSGHWMAISPLLKTL
tara:strand:- start:542 stop:1351 length:810 start_codon:yes stop_codon:yes gene_type:complete